MKRRIYIKGIYAIKINDKFYVGKDTQIHKQKRLKEHLNLLKKDKHYNKYLQRAFNKYREYEYFVLFESVKISNEELSRLEMKYIELMDSYNNGYNLTLGGEGGLGLNLSEEEKLRRSEAIKGEKNPMSKLTNEQFFEIVELFKQEKDNKEIAELYGLHSRYVSLIRHKRRFQHLWKEVDYEPKKSNKRNPRQKITYEIFLEIVKMIENGETNASIERRFSLSSGMGSRIRHKKIHKKFWKKYEQEN